MSDKIMGKRVIGSLVFLVLISLFISLGHNAFSVQGNKESKVIFVVK